MTSTETMKEMWSRSVHDKLGEDYAALAAREQHYASAKAAADYMDEKKIADTRDYLQKTMPSHLALFDRTVEEQKANAARATSAEPFNLELIVTITDESRIYLPVRQDATSALCKDLYDHVETVAKALEKPVDPNNSDAMVTPGAVPFGNYTIIKTGNNCYEKIQDMLAKAPPTFNAANIAVGAYRLRTDIAPLPSKEEYELPVKPSYYKPPYLVIPVPLHDSFPGPGIDFKLLAAGNERIVHMTNKNNNKQRQITGMKAVYDDLGVDPNDTLMMSEVKPMEVYRVRVVKATS